MPGLSVCVWMCMCERNNQRLRRNGTAQWRRYCQRKIGKQHRKLNAKERSAAKGTQEQGSENTEAKKKQQLIAKSIYKLIEIPQYLVSLYFGNVNAISHNVRHQSCRHRIHEPIGIV